MLIPRTSSTGWLLRRKLFKSALKSSHRCKSISSILIANRGEIACRIIRTAKALGIRSVVVFSDADRNSLHTRMADEAYYIGRPPSLESYLRTDKIIDVAKKAAVDAIHPGYGFLSENADFAEELEQENIIFIGPPASAIRDMGIKSRSKQIMEEAGVPVIPGYHGQDQSFATLKEEAGKIGYPVMVKAVRGGGGKGMRVAETEKDLDDAIKSARQEAMQAVKDDVLLLERFIQRPRHVEVQIFGDQHGNAVYLYERDCSVQRRHQKIIEEAPAPQLSPDLRKQLGEAAVRAALAVNYTGAGTVEFVLAPSGEIFFMEMNTRLQVEHPITECITGTDLVEWQIRVAEGEKLPLTQKQIPLMGHAFEARIYAEDPNNNFMPAPGPLHRLRMPQSNPPHVRVETGVREGDEVSIYYDPMIAKLVVWSPSDREAALGLLKKCLAQVEVLGTPCNVDFLIRLASHPEFAAGNVHTGFIPEHESSLMAKPESVSGRRRLQAALAVAVKDASAAVGQDPWSLKTGWRLSELYDTDRILLDKEAPILVTPLGGKRYKVRTSESPEDCVAYAEWLSPSMGEFLTEIDGLRETVRAVLTETGVTIFAREGSSHFEVPKPAWETSLEHGLGAGTTSVAPMPGVIQRVDVVEGSPVTVGQPMLTLIAMKMEYIIRAPSDCLVKKLLVKPGDSVRKGDKLVEFEVEKLEVVAN
ncbi:unnamed protein product [Cyprideis torosa]|uniref:Uncharacterized protein n=1 Tax=Cyprideis torosa TaxID=163714 RepID=A0A7R8WHF2_9CRUS|nr:unnamed protein product [Cyprideis torosa]CAG0896560.1 unnamed protein product [Cyprideis torosa]